MISFLIFYALLLCLVPQEHFVCFETIYYSTLDIGSSVMDSIKHSLMIFLGYGKDMNIKVEQSFMYYMILKVLITNTFDV